MSIDDKRMRVELSAINGLNPLSPCVSGARQQMLGSFLTQNNVIAEPNRMRFRGGLEKEAAKGTWDLRFEENSTVIARIPRYSSRVYGTEFDLNPMDIVIVELEETGQLDYIELPRYHCMHQQYGFAYKYNEDEYARIRRNERFKKDTVIARSPAVTEDGDWMPGRNVNVIQMTHPAGIEDGFLMSESCAKAMRVRGIESRVGTCGKKYYPIDTYGKQGEFKIFPDIGDYIDSTGLLFALRPYDDILDSIYMTGNRLKTPIYNLDRPTFGQPNARVIDIEVFHNEKASNPNMPDSMTEQLRKYYDADRHFYLEIIKTCLGRHGIAGWDKMRLTNRLNILITYGIGICGDLLVKEGLWNRKDQAELQLPKSYRGEPLDEWRFKITYEYLSDIDVGPKFTCLHSSQQTIH